MCIGFTTIVLLVGGGVLLGTFSEFKTDAHNNTPEAAWEIAEKQRTTAEIQRYFIIFAGWVGMCSVIFNHTKSLYHHFETETSATTVATAQHINLEVQPLQFHTL